MYIALGMTLVMILGGIDLSVGSIVAMSGTLTVASWRSIICRCGSRYTGPGARRSDRPDQRVGRRLFQNSIVHRHPRDAQRRAGRRIRLQRRPFDENDGPDVHRDGLRLPSGPSAACSLHGGANRDLRGSVNRTKFGTYIYAIGGNRESARLSGVPIKKVEIVTFTISGLLAAFAGLVLSARMFSGQPSVGIGYELDAIAACVFGGASMSGGIGRISGTFFGAIVIGIIATDWC